jgi:hypothetical protein
MGPFHHLPKQKDQWGREKESHEALWEMVQKYDDDMCKAWKEDCIDTLLVFVSQILLSYEDTLSRTHRLVYSPQ